VILKILVVAIIGAATTWGGSPLVRLLFRLADRSESPPAITPAVGSQGSDAAETMAADLNQTAEITQIAVTAQTAETGAIEAAADHLRGGFWIGLLERLAIFATIMAGFGQGLIVILGVKSLARYPELRAEDRRGAAERFIIGTFASSLVAAAGAGLALWIISLW
jgi:F0F1-type ATP synthase membrane subunit c/vacuolar-type H+-ATPase subunit K